MKITTPIYSLAFMAILSVCAVLLASCASTSIITEYDQTGAVIKTIETKESVAKVITGDLKDKTVVSITNGWGAKISVGAQVESGLTPSLDMRAGKFGIFYGSFQKEIDSFAIADIVRSSKESLSITPAGIASGKTDTLPERKIAPAASLLPDIGHADLSAVSGINEQLAIVKALQQYDGTGTHASVPETYAESLADCRRIMETYASAGLKETRVRVKSVTTEGGKITSLAYAFFPDAGEPYDTECPSCTPWELPEMLETPAKQ